VDDVIKIENEVACSNLLPNTPSNVDDYPSLLSLKREELKEKERTKN